MGSNSLKTAAQDGQEGAEPGLGVREDMGWEPGRMQERSGPPQGPERKGQRIPCRVGSREEFVEQSG